MNDKYEVEVNAGFTKQIKAYEPVRCDISIRIRGDDKEELYKEANEFVETKLVETMNEITEQFKN
jgi:hypothetical protein